MFIIDIDYPAKARPIYKSFNHWLVTNIPGQGVVYGDRIFEHIGPIPDDLTGKLMNYSMKTNIL